jgi:hypothetical protein
VRHGLAGQQALGAPRIQAAPQIGKVSQLLVIVGAECVPALRATHQISVEITVGASHVAPSLYIRIDRPSTYP